MFGLGKLRSLLDPSAAQAPPEEPPIISPEEIKRRRILARKLMEEGGSFAPVQSGWQGLARLGSAVNGAIEEYQTTRDEKSGSKAFADGLARVLGGGADQPTDATPSAPPISAKPAATTAPAMTRWQKTLAGIDDRYEPDDARKELAQWNENPRADTLTGLNPQKAVRLAAFLEDNPYEASIGISSGFRSPERQAELFSAAVQKYGSEEAARKWVAPPGRSQHNHGNATDLGFDDPRAREWAHANAGRYGLAFPMKHEPWHVELARDASTPVAQRSVTAFAGSPRTSARTATDADQPRIALPAPSQSAPMPPQVPSGDAPVADKGPWNALTPEAADAMRKPAMVAQATPQQAAPAQMPAARSASVAQPQTPAMPDPVPATSSRQFQEALRLMQSPAFAYANDGQRAIIQGIVQRGLSQEAVDPMKRALTQEQLTAAQLSNAEARRRAGQTEMETRDDPATGRPMQRPKGSSGAFMPVQGMGAKEEPMQLVDVPNGDGTVTKMWLRKGEASGVGVGKPFKPGAQDGGPKRSLVPVDGVDKDGNPVLLQVDSEGNANQMKLPDGVKVSRGWEKVDTGTEFIFYDKKTGQIMGRQPKDLTGKEAQEAIGASQGKVAAAAPSSISTAEQTLKDIEGIRKHPSNNNSWFGSGLGATGVLARRVPGSEAYGFNQRIEQLKGKTFMEAYNGLRGGGAITDAEGAKATQALARLDAAQSQKDFNEALGDLESVVKSGVERAKQMGERFGTVQPSPVSPPARASSPGGFKIIGVQ